MKQVTTRQYKTKYKTVYQTGKKEEYSSQRENDVHVPLYKIINRKEMNSKHKNDTER